MNSLPDSTPLASSPSRVSSSSFEKAGQVRPNPARRYVTKKWLTQVWMFWGIIGVVVFPLYTSILTQHGLSLRLSAMIAISTYTMGLFLAMYPHYRRRLRQTPARISLTRDAVIGYFSVSTANMPERIEAIPFDQVGGVRVRASVLSSSYPAVWRSAANKLQGEPPLWKLPNGQTVAQGRSFILTPENASWIEGARSSRNGWRPEATVKQSSTVPVPSQASLPPQSGPAQVTCDSCGRPAQYILQYHRYYCPSCALYFQERADVV